MNEKRSHRHEQNNMPSEESNAPSHNTLKHTPEKAAPIRHEHAEKIDSIRQELEKTATSSEKAMKHHEDTEQEKPQYVNRELKSMAYQRTLKRTQRQLPVASRTFSKVIHHPAIEAMSEIGAKTIARPSGVLVGGITAFIGSTIFLWIARYYGYEYNFLLFALLFIGGFFIGLLVELGLYAASKRQR